jgi:iron complex transport system permease protein
MDEPSNAFPKCCPSCSADLRADEQGLCWHCRKPLPEELLKGPAPARTAPVAPRAESSRPARGDRRPVKVTLDLTQLLEDGKISQEEHDRLIVLSRKNTKLHAFSIFQVLAILALVGGTVGLFPDFFTGIGQALLDLFGPRGLHLLAVLLSGVGAVLADSGFLAAVSAFGFLTFLGDTGLFYSHATYFVAIEEPALTVLLFSVLGYASYAAAGNLKTKEQRLVIIFSRTCLFIVNLAFWVGSLWGSKLAGMEIPDVVFALGWAVALVAVGAWAASQDKRWVVNTTAVFGSIHFYTQWFERLGASPASLLVAGATALGILYGIREYNRPPAHGRMKG